MLVDKGRKFFSNKGKFRIDHLLKDVSEGHNFKRVGGLWHDRSFVGKARAIQEFVCYGKNLCLF